jgi:hypothetical protein
MRSQTTPLRSQNDPIDPKEASVNVWHESNNPNQAHLLPEVGEEDGDEEVENQEVAHKQGLTLVHFSAQRKPILWNTSGT